MKDLIKLLRTPYPYIFLLSYAGVWLMWDHITLPFSNPSEIVSYLPSIEYNPTSNLVRFAVAVFLPPLACLLYWWLAKHQKALQARASHPGFRYGIAAVLVSLSLFLALGMGIVQNSTNPANNPPATYGGPYTHAMVDTFHEGETLGPAISYSRPDLAPYKDFVIVHGVFQDPLRTVLAFKMFGKSIGASRAMATILVIITFVMLYVLLLVLFRGDLLRSAIGMIAFAALVLPPSLIPLVRDYILGIQLPFRDTVTILFLIAAVLGFRFFLDKKPKHAAAMAGIVGFLAIAGFGSSIDRAFYIVALSVVWLGMMLAISNVRDFLRNTARWFGIGAVAGFAVLAWALKGQFSDFLQYVADITLRKEFLDGMIFKQPGPEVTIILLGIAASIGLAAFWVIRELNKPSVTNQHKLSAKIKVAWPIVQNIIREHHTLILLGITALVFMRSALGRALIDHFVYAIEWFYLFVIYAVLAYAYPMRKKIGLAFGFIAVIALFFTALIYAGQIKQIDIAADTFPVNIKDEQIVRKDYLEAADYLKQNLSGDETFVTFTSEGIWYYLVDKPSPVRYPIIWYAFTKPERVELANAIEHNDKIKFIVTNDHWTMNFDFIPNADRFPEAYEAFHRLYEPHVGFGSQTIWIRK